MEGFIVVIAMSVSEQTSVAPTATEQCCPLMDLDLRKLTVNYHWTTIINKIARVHYG